MHIEQTAQTPRDPNADRTADPRLQALVGDQLCARRVAPDLEAFACSPRAWEAFQRKARVATREWGGVAALVHDNGPRERQYLRLLEFYAGATLSPEGVAQVAPRWRAAIKALRAARAQDRPQQAGTCGMPAP
jgi:hypothetical protein